MKINLFFLLLIISTKIYSKTFEIVKEHSKINFDVEYMMMTNVSGTFSDYKGFFEFNDEENSISKIKVTINSNSINTDDKKRDFHLKGHEFLFTSSFPEILFESNKAIDIKAGKKIKITGALTIRETKKEITFEGFYKGKNIDPWNKYNYFFEFESVINRKDFGIVWNKEMDNGGFLVGDEVKIKFLIQAQDINNKTSFSTHMIPSTKGIVERDQLRKGKIKKLSTSTKEKTGTN